MAQVVTAGDLQRYNLSSKYSAAQHVAHAELLAAHLSPLLKAGSRCVDMGAGSGIVGLVCGFAFPQVEFTLLDARAACCEALRRAVTQLGLHANVVVLHSRAEATGRSVHRHGFDGVLSRRFGPPGTTAECAAPLLRRGGFALVSGPPSDEAWPAHKLSELGLAVEARLLTPPAVVLRSVKLCSGEYPRRRRLQQPLWPVKLR